MIKIKFTKPKAVPKKKIKMVTLFDINRNPIQVKSSLVQEYLEKGFSKIQPPAQVVDPLNTAQGRFDARRPSES